MYTFGMYMGRHMRICACMFAYSKVCIMNICMYVCMYIGRLCMYVHTHYLYACIHTCM